MGLLTPCGMVSSADGTFVGSRLHDRGDTPTVTVTLRKKHYPLYRADDVGAMASHSVPHTGIVKENR